MWHNPDEIETAIGNFAATYPAIAEQIPLPEPTWGIDAATLPRSVSALRIGVNAGDAADGALFIFGQHAREWIPPEVALELAAALLGAFAGGTGLVYGGKSYSAADVQRILTNINIFLVPCVNPDGRQVQPRSRYVESTRRLAQEPEPHVDSRLVHRGGSQLQLRFRLRSSRVLRRHRSGRDDVHVHRPVQLESGLSRSQRVLGAETRNVKWLIDNYPRIRWFIDIHGYTSAGEIYYPWGDDENQNTKPAMNWRNPAFDHQRGREADAYQEFMNADDFATHVYLANRLRDGVQPVNGRTYIVKQSFGLYPTGGASDDYTWSRHLQTPSLPRIESFAIEHRGTSFHTTNLVEQDEVIREVTSGLVNFSLAWLRRSRADGGAAHLQRRVQSLSRGTHFESARDPSSDRLRGRDVPRQIRSEPDGRLDAYQLRHGRRRAHRARGSVPCDA